MNVHKLSVRGYLGVLSNTDLDMIELLDTEFADRTRYKGSTNAIARTWIVSFEKIKEDADAAAILSFLSFVEPRAIPLSMLPRRGSKQKLTRALGVLCAYSFLVRRDDGESFDMHRLVHLASRVWVRQQSDVQKQGLDVILHLGSFLVLDEMVQREIWPQYLSHVLEALKVRAADAEWHVNECFIGSRAGGVLRDEGRLDKAADLLQKTVNALKIMLPQENPQVLETQHQLAGVYLDLGMIEEGLQLLRHVEQALRDIVPPASLSLMLIQKELAEAYSNNGQEDEALKLWNHVIQIHEGVEPDPGDLHCGCQIERQRLVAMTYLRIGQNAKGFDLFRQVPDLIRKSPRPNTLQLIDTQRLLVKEHFTRRQFKQAL
jgi:tetratricopeptide (TPR) repeat protein